MLQRVTPEDFSGIFQGSKFYQLYKNGTDADDTTFIDI